MHSIVLKNDAVGDLTHSIQAINNITSSSERVTIFLSKLSENYSFLIKKPNVEIRILNYKLTLIEKIKLIFFLKKNTIDKVYILSPKAFYYYLPLIFKKIKFYAICVDNIKNYKRPSKFFRKHLFKYVVNDRGKIFKRESTRTIQNQLTSHDDGELKYKFNFTIDKSDILKKYLPKNYIFFHFKKKIFNELNWQFSHLQILFHEFGKYSDNIVLTKDIDFDNNNILFKDKFNSYDFKSRKFIDNKMNVLFLDNIVGEELLNVIKDSQKVVAFHGMMTNLGFILNKAVLDLYHCKINSWEDYRRYRNSFYEFKPKHNDYDFIIPKKDINQTIKKIRFSLKRCKKN